jgi:tRNA (cmo5U34)-methyltransferase
MMWDRWGEHLTAIKGAAYRDAVYAYVEKKDSPRPLVWQLELLLRTGFTRIEVLHVNSWFGCYGAVRPDQADTNQV